MSATAKDLYDELARIRYDLTAAQAKITNLQNLLNTLDLPQQQEPPFACPVQSCGLHKKTRLLLDDHLRNVHGIERELIQ